MEKICQSCGMPITSEELAGTYPDGSKNMEYCKYCFQNGEFTQNFTMEEMIEHNLQFLNEFNKEAGTSMNREEAIAGMREYFPHLKRWMSAD